MLPEQERELERVRKRAERAAAPNKDIRIPAKICKPCSCVRCDTRSLSMEALEDERDTQNNV